MQLLVMYDCVSLTLWKVILQREMKYNRITKIKCTCGTHDPVFHYISKGLIILISIVISQFHTVK